MSCLKKFCHATVEEKLGKWFGNPKYTGCCQLIDAAKQILQIKKVFIGTLFIITLQSKTAAANPRPLISF